jgi:peptide deformylase
MAVLPIVKHPDPRLRVKCKKVSRIDASLQRLADDMLETMRAANGVGLAAPQVGVPLRLIVVELPDDYEDPLAGKPIVVFNPEILKSSGEWEPEEGCLSIPGWVANVKRAEAVTIKGRDREGREVRYKADGLLGHAFQHEVDHLDGVLFIDLVDSSQVRRAEEGRTATERAKVQVKVQVNEAAAVGG